VVALADVFRLGYFADDFIFLDAVGRHPLWEVLLGQHGVGPWYRPLARELFFALTGPLGRAGPAVGHALSVAAVWVTADSLWRIVARRMDGRVAAAAVALFLAHSVTRFLAGWLSGFQDLLALALMLLGLRLRQEGRVARAAICVGLAPFAKETGFLALPLLALDIVLGERRAPAAREVVPYASAAGAALLAHGLVRASWPEIPHQPARLETLREAPSVLWQAATSWIGSPGPATPWAWGAAALVALIAFVLLRRFGVVHPDRVPGLPVLVPVALILCAAPAVVAAIIAYHVPRSHFLYAALPWWCVLAGWSIWRFAPRGVPAPAVALVCGLLVWNGNARRVDLDAAAGWDVGPLNWAEAQRIEARTRRLGDNVRSLLAERPESLVVVYVHVPSGAWFQTDDGPATRIALGDPTVTAYFIKDLPGREAVWANRPLAALDYDPVERHALVRRTPEDPILLRRWVMAILTGNRDETGVLSRLAEQPGAGTPLSRYIAAVAPLVLDADSRALARIGPGDRAESATIGVGDPRGDAAVRRALEQPLLPEGHVAAADSLAAAGLPMLEALELAVAVQLDTTRAADALRLGRLLATRAPTWARRAYRLASSPSASPTIAASARQELQQLRPVPPAK